MQTRAVCHHGDKDCQCMLGMQNALIFLTFKFYVPRLGMGTVVPTFDLSPLEVNGCSTPCGLWELNPGVL